MTGERGNDAANRPGTPGSASAIDLEVRKYEIHQKYAFGRHSVTALSILTALYLAPRCLTVLRDTVVPFAGEQTVVNAQIAVSLTLAVSAIIIALVFRVRSLRSWATSESQRADELRAILLGVTNETPLQ